MVLDAIKVLLACTALFGSVTVFGAHGLWLGVVAVALTIFVASGPTPAACGVRAGGIAFLVAITFSLLPLYSRAGPAAWRVQCGNNLKQIGLALHTYHNTLGSFPPAHLANDTGEPAHSWRVLLLPFMEQQRLYDHYDFDEPWDGPRNSRLAPERLYQCPSRGRSPGAKVSTTDYFAVIGPDTAWPGAEARKLDEFADPSQTILVIERFDREVPWSAPSDLTVEEAAVVPSAHVSLLAWWLRLEPTEGAPYHQFAGRHALFADGSVLLLPIDLSPSDFRSLVDVRDLPKPFLPPAAQPLPDALKGLPVYPFAIRWAGFALFLASLGGTGLRVRRGRARLAQQNSPVNVASYNT